MKIFVMRSRYFLTLALLVTALIVIAAVKTSSDVNKEAVQVMKLLPIYCVGSEEKKACLTFDAAWGNEDTQQLIDTLGNYGVSATFFVVGDWAGKYPESVKALYDAGHEVMSHSNKHNHMPALSKDDIIADLTTCNERIAAVTGVTPTLFRAPYGDYNDTLISAVSEMGMKTIQWDVDSLDWKDLSAPDITTRVLERVQPGSIILFHNAAKHTPEALPGIIEALQKDGYTLVPVSELILDGDYTIDHTGRQLAS